MSAKLRLLGIRCGSLALSTMISAVEKETVDPAKKLSNAVAIVLAIVIDVAKMQPSR